MDTKMFPNPNESEPPITQTFTSPEGDQPTPHARPNKFVEFLRTKKGRYAAAGVLVLIVIASLLAALIGQGSTGDKKPAPSQPAAKTTENRALEEPETVTLQPETGTTWNEESSPIILHVEGQPTNSAQPPVDFYHAIPRQKANADNGRSTDTVKLHPGTYTIRTISPVNRDGSIEVLDAHHQKLTNVKGNDSFDFTINSSKTESSATHNSAPAPSASTDAKASSSQTEPKAPTQSQTQPKPKPEITIPMVHTPADQVSEEQIKKINEETKEAIAKGDESLKGEKGEAVATQVAENSKNNPHVSQETKTEIEQTKTNAVSNANTTPAVEPVQPVTPATKPQPEKPAQPASQPQPEKKRRWVEPTYKTVQKTCTQSYQEKVIDQPARTETKPYEVQVYSNGMEFDLRTTTLAQMEAIIKPLRIEALKKGYDITSSTVTRYETVTIPEKSHMETRTRNYSCNEQVVDIPGHWEEY